MRLNQSAFLLFFLEICFTATRLDSIHPLLEKLMNHVIAVSCILFLSFRSSLSAIETSEAVKVTQVLKTSQSWDGVLLNYPQGQLEIRLRNGKKNVVRAGDALAEVVNTAHSGKNIGTEPVLLLIFYAGAVGQANSASLMEGN
ncbi:cupin domain-containing protein [Rheinheimera mangrovi]|uniref:cupin domain-containing protein n=1 Tax=Rheinheimera mangrovi TaxID=2498451 RepID=UPI001E53F60B|nr:cupin domain-containing protein [Rheinheimera mangrovi]